MIYARRFNLLKQWIAGRRHGVGFAELSRHLFAPLSRSKAQKFIEGIEEDGDDYRLKLKGLALPLYYPKAAGLGHVYQVISEIFRPDEWHYYEIQQTALRPDDIVADCGAAEGLFSLKAAAHCRKVYAIEPLPLFIVSLRKTFETVGNVEIVPWALGATSGASYLSESGILSAISVEPTGTAVKITTIDDMFFHQKKALTYLKADLEGYELEMLAGAKETIRVNRPRIAITTYHKADHADRIKNFLREIHPGYNLLTKGLEDSAGAPVMLHAW